MAWINEYFKSPLEGKTFCATNFLVEDAVLDLRMQEKKVTLFVWILFDNEKSKKFV